MIDSFTGKYRFLSNFHLHKDGKSVEHYFQAAKAVSVVESVWVMDSDTPAEAKKRGRKVIMRPNWDLLKLAVMDHCLQRKFTDPELRQMLLDTGEEELVEGNYWNDTYWGVCNGIGENHLGKLLMKTREDIRNAAVRDSK